MLRSAFVVGASGAVGKQLVDALVSSHQFKKVLVVGRREIPLSHENVEQAVIDFDTIEKHADLFKDIDVGFCALGTTRGKAGKEGFYKVDHDYVLNTAKVAKEQEHRFGESLAKIFVKPLKMLSNSIAISTADVAKAMVVGACSSELKGKVIWDNATLLEKKDSFESLCK
ncbi:hypothetical protein OSTOST_11747 [Ostertagia ostertagi]